MLSLRGTLVNQSFSDVGSLPDLHRSGGQAPQVSKEYLGAQVPVLPEVKTRHSAGAILA